MTDIVLPSALRIARSTFRYVDNTGISRSVYNGAIQTTSLGGDRVGASIEFTQHGGRPSAEQSLRGQLRAFLMSLRGKQNRVYLTDTSYQQTRGTWSSVCGGEMLGDPTFSDNAAWSASAGITDLCSDNTYRATLTANISTSTDLVIAGGVLATTQYAPYVQRWHLKAGSLSVTGQFRFRGPGAIGTSYETALTNPNGYYTFAYVTESTATVPVFNVGSLSGSLAGQFVEFTFASMSRCFLADGGGNVMLQSDTIDNASWGKSACTISANATAAPDGTTTADAVVENSATSAHTFSQNGTRTLAVVDLCTYGYFKRGSGTRDIRLVAGNNATNYSICIFNLLAGTASSVSNVGTATNGRAFIVSAGNGWYFCCLVSRAEAATTITAEFDMVNAGNVSYTGDSTSSVYAWRCGATVSQVPTRGTQTTSAAVAAATQTGSSIYVKGLPASQAGLLVQGDWFEIDGQIKMVTAPLNTDSAGCGYLQFSPPLYRAVADNTPIIVNKPMGRFIANAVPEWGNDPGVFSGASLDLEEAFA